QTRRAADEVELSADNVDASSAVSHDLARVDGPDRVAQDPVAEGLGAVDEHAVHAVAADHVFRAGLGVADPVEGGAVNEDPVLGVAPPQPAGPVGADEVSLDVVGDGQRAADGNAAVEIAGDEVRSAALPGYADQVIGG